MKCESGETLFPADFLGVAERFGLIQEIDRWVMRRAIRFISEHQLDKKGLFLEVNLSGLAFNDAELLQIIRHELNVSRINPKSLAIEIT